LRQGVSVALLCCTGLRLPLLRSKATVSRYFIYNRYCGAEWRKIIFMKKILLSAVAALSLATATQAQTVPSYVPTNGLVGWWPFNGNANDESGNGNNGTVNGATLINDRDAQLNSAYNFNGIDNFINLPLINMSSYNEFSLSVWVNVTDFQTGFSNFHIIRQEGNGGLDWLLAFQNYGNIISFGLGIQSQPYTELDLSINPINFIDSWSNIVVTYDGSIKRTFIDGVLFGSEIKSGLITFTSSATNAIGSACSNVNCVEKFRGKIDDIAIWNRALTQQEITDLYNAVNCNLSITPQNNVLQIGNTATFNATTSDPNPNYVWQSDFGQGFQTLNNYGNYSGVNTNTLTIANVQLANHNQAIRAISTSGNCVDTSNVAYIHIADTCVTTVNDTNLITVTDTLLININTVGLNQTPVQNTIKVFPNPANTNLNLDFGNFNNLNGYSIKIYNSLSQVIYNQSITQQSETIDLSTFGGNGIYFLHVINAQNNTIEIRKIVLQ